MNDVPRLEGLPSNLILSRAARRAARVEGWQQTPVHAAILRDARRALRAPRALRMRSEASLTKVQGEGSRFAPNSRDSRSAAACTIFERLCNAWMVRRQTGPDMPSAPTTLPVKS